MSAGEATPGALPQSYWLIEQAQAQLTEGGVIEEALLDLYVNGQELATIMCSPLQQEALALGFLYTEGVIDSLDEVGLVQANLPRTVVDVLLKRADFEPPRRMVLTSGCGGGVTLQHITESYPPLCSDFRTESAVITAAHARTAGRGAVCINWCAACISPCWPTPVQKLLLSAEDVGRHNAVDKIAGLALQAGIDTRDRLLLTSGRISSEMLSKARRMDISRWWPAAPRPPALPCAWPRSGRFASSAMCAAAACASIPMPGAWAWAKRRSKPSRTSARPPPAILPP